MYWYPCPDWDWSKPLDAGVLENWTCGILPTMNGLVGACMIKLFAYIQDIIMLCFGVDWAPLTLWLQFLENLMQTDFIFYVLPIWVSLVGLEWLIDNGWCHYLGERLRLEFLIN
jgi:hypothetical protein